MWWTMSMPKPGVTQEVASLHWSGDLTYAIEVSDLERSIAWYTSLLGCRVLYQLDDWGWSELLSPVASFHIGVGQVEKPQVDGPTMTFGTTDIAADRAMLEAAGVRFDGETRHVADMVHLATFYDPDGNTLMLAQRDAPAK
jgi:catechol 2,3-dioxygenase-like lactoylglutathione lyase family enzyme